MVEHGCDPRGDDGRQWPDADGIRVEHGSDLRADDGCQCPDADADV